MEKNVNKEKARECFIKHYNKAIDEYNKKSEPEFFFQPLRDSIEYLAHWLIHDIVDDKRYINQLYHSKKRVKLWDTEIELPSKLECKSLINIIPSILSAKKSFEKFSDKKRAEKDVNTACVVLCETFDLASECACHAYFGPMTLLNHAKEHIYRVPNFIEKLKDKNILSSEFLEYFENNISKFEDYELKLIQYIDDLSKANNELKEINAKLEAATITEKEAYKKEKKDLLDKIKKLQDDITLLTPTSPPVLPLDVDIIKDDDQLDLIEMELSESMLVAGCAGSGKSLIAIKKAQQILKEQGDVILIAYTNSLKEYISHGIKDDLLSKRVYTQNEWSKCKKQADYIIVDEIQDFTEKEIKEFIAATQKSYFFFGDTAQSIYEGLKDTLNINKISKVTNLEPLILHSNYRLPRPVARITQEYIGIDVNKYSDKIYKSKETVLPHIIGYQSFEDGRDTIISILKEKHQKDVGILFYSNQEVCDFYQYCLEKKILVECKYDIDNPNIDKKIYKNTLNFENLTPKILTYHSAKGLQFETVIIPNFTPTTKNDKDMRKSQYVAMTRTYKNLYVMYEGNMPEPLINIPQYLYSDKL